MKKNALSEIDWEIHQLSLAIRYYEEAHARSIYVSEANKYDKIIKDLNRRIKDLEAKNYEYGR